MAVKNVVQTVGWWRGRRGGEGVTSDGRLAGDILQDVETLEYVGCTFALLVCQLEQ